MSEVDKRPAIIAAHNEKLEPEDMMYGFDDLPMDARTWASAINVIESAGFQITSRLTPDREAVRKAIESGMEKAGDCFYPDVLIPEITDAVMSALAQSSAAGETM